jgi:hypothetical protein
MSTQNEQRLRSALDDLAGGPLPADLASRAIAQAGRNRRWRHAVLAGAATLAVTAAVPVAVSLGGTHPGGTRRGGGSTLAVPANATATRPVHAASCEQAPSVSATVKEVARADWPEFVRTIVAALPARSDYVMQSGWSWCDYDSSESNAYAVINVGHLREHGHLTVNMYIHATGVPADCPALRALVKKPLPDTTRQRVVLFCADRTATTPMVVGLSFSGQVTVGANYADGRSIVMESIPNPGQPFAVTAEQLRDAVTDRSVYNVIPDTAAPAPSAAPVPLRTPPSPVG